MLRPLPLRRRASCPTIRRLMRSLRRPGLTCPSMPAFPVRKRLRLSRPLRSRRTRRRRAERLASSRRPCPARWRPLSTGLPRPVREPSTSRPLALTWHRPLGSSSRSRPPGWSRRQAANLRPPERSRQAARLCLRTWWGRRPSPWSAQPPNVRCRRLQVSACGGTTACRCPSSSSLRSPSWAPCSRPYSDGGGNPCGRPESPRNRLV